MAQALDFFLRCNSMKCRTPLNERAVVTTCSHIFCLTCAEKLGLSKPLAQTRQCPACQTLLQNPDDAVATVLNPTEDYKTSVLSGLDPHIIIECAGRALSFWAYQTTQEIQYQEYLEKSLTDKYSSLNSQMDKIIHSANSELSDLQAKLYGQQQSQEQLRKKNQELVTMYREKCKKLTQVTNLYNQLKSRSMRSQMQTAASDSVSHTLNSLPVPQQAAVFSGRPDNMPALPANPFHPATLPFGTYSNRVPGVEQLHRHQRSGSVSSRGAAHVADISSNPPRTTSNKQPYTSATYTGLDTHHRTRLTAPTRTIAKDGHKNYFEATNPGSFPNMP